MTFKQKLEESPSIVVSAIAIAAAVFGWEAHIQILSQTKQDVVLQSSYVMKEEIESGKSPLYVSRKELDLVMNNYHTLEERLAQTSHSDSKIKGIERESQQTLSKLTACQKQVTALSEKNRSFEAKSCTTILDNYYVHSLVGNYNVSACLADSTNAATKLNASFSRRDNAIQIRGELGTVDGYFCNIACHANLISVSCNSLDRKTSLGLTAQIRDYLTYK